MNKNQQEFSNKVQNVIDHFNAPMKGSKVEQFQVISAQMKLRRRIEDYMRKYATAKQLTKIANFLGISN